MKFRYLVFLAVAAMVLTLAACRPHGFGPYVVSDSAELRGLSITSADGVTVSAARIPGGIDETAYDDYDDEFGMTLQPWETITLKLEEHYVGARIRPIIVQGAKVEVGFGDRATRPAYYVDARVPVTFEPNQYIYLKVISEDASKVMYYRFYAPRLSVVTNLSDVFIEGRRQEVLDGGNIWSNAQEGRIDLTARQAQRVDIDAVGFDETSTFRFARVPADPNGYKQPLTEPETYQDSNRFTTFKDQDYLYIEVIAQNGKDRQYYCFLITVGRIVNIAKLEMLPPAGDPVEVLGIGFSAPDWAGVRLGAFSTAEPDPSFNIKVTLEDTAGSWSYGRTGGAIPAFQTSGAVTFNDNDLLAIEVVSDNGKAKAYYKVKVSLLAGVFTEHPKSAQYLYYKAKPSNYDEHVNATGGSVKFPDEPPITDPKNPAYSTPANEAALAEYLIYLSLRDDYYSPTVFTTTPDAQVEALSATLAKPIASFNYQWYESNSWYGGYGFDAYGHFNHPNNTMEGVPDKDFQEDIWHQQAYDEKMNVSLFNGGNQSARYLYTGFKVGEYLPAAEAKTIPNSSGSGAGSTVPGPKPNLEWRPLLKDTSSHYHYYWVEITDNSNNRKVTSERAVIVSERNNAIKHFIIDVNNTPVRGKMGVNGTYGTKRLGGFKNPIAFKEQYDEYYVDLTDILTSSWNVMDYKTLTVQAKFYLQDGTAWTQNWTQGNVGFNGVASGTTTSGRLWLAHNLTNDNGMYGLADGAKEPSVGIPLTDTPDSLVVQPSGDHKKGNNKDGYPPLEDWTGANDKVAYGGVNGDQVAAQSIVGSNMQGWFCGFVEIVELRFEGPGR